MKFNLFFINIILSALCFGATGASAEGLEFNDSGELKIVQITDTHYKTGKKASRTATRCIASVLDAENPDLVVLTGDLLYSDRGIEAIDSVMAPIIVRGLPFAFVFGNHDTQFDLSYPEFYDYISALPGSIMPPRGDAESPDYVVTVGAAKDSTEAAAALYFLDSHRGSKLKRTGKYDWLKKEQILWYKAASDSLGRIPALMFLHIPLPETAYADASAKSSIIGTMGEKVCSPDLNSGMFCAIKEQGDVKGVFFGHDHDNDFAAAYYDVLLAYGRYSGGKTVYNHIGTPGARVIVLQHDDPSIRTWLRLADGTVIHDITFLDGKMISN